MLAFISTADPGSSIISFGGTKNKEHFNSKSMQVLASSDSSLSMELKLRSISVLDPGLALSLSVDLKIRSNSDSDPGSGVISFVGTTNKDVISLGGTKNREYFSGGSRLWRYLFRRD